MLVALNSRVKFIGGRDDDDDPSSNLNNVNVTFCYDHTNADSTGSRYRFAARGNTGSHDHDKVGEPTSTTAIQVRTDVFSHTDSVDLESALEDIEMKGTTPRIMG